MPLFFYKYYAFSNSTVFNLQRATGIKMTDENSVEHLTVVMTTETVVDVIQTTAADVATSSSSSSSSSPPPSSSSLEFYFQCSVVVIGIVGMAANALILYGLIASKQHKKHLLIFNQNALDFLSCLFLVITYTLKLCNFHLTGLSGYWFCMLTLSENMIWYLILTSKVNLVFVTIERYLKAVYPVWSKKKLSKWMIYLAMAFAWISSVVHMTALTFSTSAVVDGVCYGYVMWKSRVSQMAYGIFYFLSYYITILIIFIFCYWRILIAVRRQAQVMAGYGTSGPSTSQAQSNQIQSNVVKTMILVSAFYAASDLPTNVYYLLLNINANLTLLDSGYYASLFISIFYFCANPFIYAIKFDPVKRVLLRLIPWKKSPVQPIETVEIIAYRAAARTAQSCKLQV